MHFTPYLNTMAQSLPFKVKVVMKFFIFMECGGSSQKTHIPPQNLAFSHLISGCISTPYFSKFTVILLSHPCQSFLSRPFPSCFPEVCINFWFLSCALRVPLFLCSSNIFQLNYSFLIELPIMEQYTIKNKRNDHFCITKEISEHSFRKISLGEHYNWSIPIEIWFKLSKHGDYCSTVSIVWSDWNWGHPKL